jgi:hypothetical protein
METPAMIAPTSNISGSVMSLEGMFLNLYLEALRQLPLSWIGLKEINTNHFNFQMNYLLSLIPDESIRAKIEALQTAEYEKYKKKQDQFAAQRSGFIVVSSIVDWLSQNFELVHNDIAGTVSAYEQDSAEYVPSSMEEIEGDNEEVVVNVQPETV